MYSIEEYGRMIADPIRMGAYSKALERAVRPDSTVLDLGAGTGIFALLACKFGARKVYAVEMGDAIAVAQLIAQANGFADRITFIQARSTEISLREKVDVIVADMHGTLPLYQSNVASILDARRRLLKEGGILIPRLETLWAAVVEAPDAYGKLVAPWEGGEFGLDMDAARHAVTNSPTRAGVSPNGLLSDLQCWGTLDYALIESPDHAASVSFPVTRTGTAHGLVLWFDAELADGIGFSNAPGEPELVYGSSFLPWPASTPLEAGDEVSVRLRADFTESDYLWSWESEIRPGDANRTRAHYRQSTFWGSPLTARRLSRRSGKHVPSLGPAGKADAWILGRMDGASTLEEIARAAMERFPARFRTLGEAMKRVGDLSDTYGSVAEGGDPTR